MRYRIERRDDIVFTDTVREHHIELRAAPWDDASQRLHHLAIRADGTGALASHRDCFGNQVHRVAVLTAHDHVTLAMTAEVETFLDNPFQLEPVPPARETVWISDSLRQAPRLWDFVLHRSPLTPDLSSEHIAGSADADGDHGGTGPRWQPNAALLPQVQAAMAWIHDRFDLDPAPSGSSDSLDGLLGTRRGSDADLAHLLISIIRGWAMPARFVVGYLDGAYFDAEPDEPPRLPPEQSLHCWVEALIPGGGWRGFDPALGLLADASYIRLGVGRDARDLTGFRHSFKGKGTVETHTTALRVERLD
jgi:transglutaminase-like putative cysteine protease